MDQPKPVAGVDTPREDDIITPCLGNSCKCQGWVVSAHPRHVKKIGVPKEGGGFEEVEPTPEWVEGEAARIAEGGRANVGCHRPHLGPMLEARA